MQFSGVENLGGGDNNKDTFVFDQGGSLSGKGTVGAIVDMTGSATPLATVAPGDNKASPPAGMAVRQREAD